MLIVNDGKKESYLNIENIKSAIECNWKNFKILENINKIIELKIECTILCISVSKLFIKLTLCHKISRSISSCS